MTVTKDLETSEEPEARKLRRELFGEEMLDRLMAATDERGVALTGQGGFLPEMIKAVLERGMGAELTDQRSFVLDLEVDQSAASGWQLQLASGASEVTCHFEKGRLTVDRSATRYPHGGTRTISVPGDDRLRVQLVHDRSVTELFVGDGQAVFSLRSYLEPGEFTVSVATRGTLAVGSAAAITVS